MHALTAFEAAARLSSFAKAAEELCLTQSAISHRIRSLEEHLNARMFVRVHNQVVLTHQGERFLESVRHAIRMLNTGADSVTSAQKRLRVTSTPGMAAQILIPYLHQFLKAHPDLELEIDTSGKVVDMLNDTYDVALRLGTGPWPGLEQQLLLKDALVALASPDYCSRFEAIADKGARLSSATLIHCRSFSWEAWQRSLEYSFEVSQPAGLNFGEVAAAMNAAVHSLGVVLSTHLASLDLRKHGLLVPFVDDVADLKQHYYILYRPDSPRMPQIRAFAEWVLGCIPHFEIDRART
jgi:LysR family glycine cleavage system transcriptional activator